MKVFISADMEGITGVTALRQVSWRESEYAQARLWMTEDVNAAVAGACEGGATEVLVRDAHGPAINILPDRLHASARLMAGWTPALDMMQGCDASFGVAFFIGYHPGPPALGGVLSHTYSMDTIREVRVNGISAGESLINAIQAGCYGVPVGLITGEEALRQEIEPALGETEFVRTKTGYGYQSALLEPMAECRERIRAAARRAVERVRSGGGYPVCAPAPPIEARIDLHKAEAALAVRLVAGVETIDTRSVLLRADSASQFIDRFQLLTQVLYGLRA